MAPCSHLLQVPVSRLSPPRAAEAPPGATPLGAAGVSLRASVWGSSDGCLSADNSLGLYVEAILEWALLYVL